MPRPCKRRRICAMPDCRCFGPREGAETERPAIVMTVDEFECIRLIDLEGMTQEQCAAQMGVARTTAQAIYNAARFKLADALVGRRELRIDGGSYTLCRGPGSCEPPCRRQCHHFAKSTNKEEPYMKIAVTYDNGQIFQHFGHTETFKVYEVENNAVIRSEVVGTNGSGHGALAVLLGGLKVDTLICGGIGGGAQMALADAGIRLYGGASGDADQAVEALLNGTLSFNPDVMCSHHEGHEGGSCGQHGCGGHSCGE